MKFDPVRLRALNLLVEVQEGALLDALLDENLEALESPREKVLLAELVRGTLQWQGRYDHVIGHFSRKQPPKDPRLINLLRLSLHQLLTLDGVPPYAAVHQAGELCRAKVAPRLVGFVNGMLQTIRREILGDWDPTAEGRGEDPRPEQLRKIFVPLKEGSPRWMAAWYSHPQWLVERWCSRFGAERTAAICESNNLSVRSAFHVLAPADPQQIATALGESGWAVAAGADSRSLQPERRLARAQWNEVLAAHPELIVQDPVVQEATAWLAENLEASVASRPQEQGAPLRLLDYCAAPGGKTAHLAARLGTNWRVTAMDSRRQRVKLLAETAAGARIPAVDLVAADGRRPPFGEASFDAVLLDGPCSGTGVLRHHPDGRWQLQPGVPGQNAKLLLELAEQAVDLLVPGGLLLYATCSLEPEENGRVLKALLKTRRDLEPATENAGRREWIPDQTGADGFFAAVLRRRHRPTEEN